MTNLESMLKSRDITLPTKVCLVKLWFFQWLCMDVRVGLWRKRSRKIDAFELQCWRRLLWIPWMERRSNQSILKEISPGCSLEGLMLKLKLNTLATSHEELTHWKRPWCWEGMRAGGEGDDRGWDGWMASATRWTWVWVSSRSCWWTGGPGVLRFMGSQRVGHDWATELIVVGIFQRNRNTRRYIERAMSHSLYVYFVYQWGEEGGIEREEKTLIMVQIWRQSRQVNSLILKGGKTFALFMPSAEGMRSTHIKDINQYCSS